MTTTAGNGIVSIAEAFIEMERFVVTRNKFIGVQIAYGESDYYGIENKISGKMKLNRGIISHNKVGANIQSESFSYLESFDNIFWSNNVNNTIGDTLFVPETGDIDVSLPGID